MIISLRLRKDLRSWEPRRRQATCSFNGNKQPHAWLRNTRLSTKILLMTRPRNTRPSDAAILERASSLASEAMWTFAMQIRRLRSKEPEDKEFSLRWWADLQF